MRSLRQERKRFNEHQINIEDTTTLDYARKQHKEAGGNINIEYDPQEVQDWFNDVNLELAKISNASQSGNLSYNSALNMKNNNDRLTELRAQSDFIRSYVDSLKGTKQYDELNKQFEDYSKGINSMLDYTKGVSDFTSQFKDENEYNNFQTEANRRQKYSNLKSYDDYIKAIESTDDESEKQWLESKAYGLADSDDIKNRLDEYNNTNAQSVPGYNTTPVAYKGNWGTTSEKSNDEKIEEGRKNLQALYQQKVADEKLEEQNEKLKNNYYSLSPDEKQTVIDYINIKEGKGAGASAEGYRAQKIKENQPDVLRGPIDTSKGYNAFDYADALAEQNKTREAVVNKAKTIAKEHNTTLDELEKWYPRGEEDDEAQYEYKKNQEEAKLEPFWRSYQSIIEKPVRDLATAAEQINAGFTDDQYINTKSLPSAKTEAVRQGVTEDWDSDIAKELYNIGMSTADSGYNMLLGALAGNLAGVAGASAGAASKVQNVVTLSPAFTSASTDTFNRVINNGGDYTNAMMSGVASGLAEVITEKVSLDQLKGFQAKGVNNLKTAIGNVAKSMFVEGSEETAADLVNTLTDNLINGGLSELELNKKKYREQGYDDKEAEKKAWGDLNRTSKNGQ